MSTEQSVQEIEALMREEQRLTAIENHHEAWAEGLFAGIDPEIIAETAMATALSELVRADGEDAALALIERMRDRIISGEFDATRSQH